MQKRTRFVFTALFIAIMMWFSGFVSVEYQFGLTVAVSAITYLLTVWVLFEDLKGIEWITLLVLPVTFVFGGAMFANFLPNSIPRLGDRVFEVETAIMLAKVVKFVYYILMGIGLYGVLLIENIFSVASIRTIQLFRAARSVNFILTLLTSLFLFTVVFSLRLSGVFVFSFAFLTAALLSFPSFWSVDLKADNFSEVARFSVAVGWLVGLYGLILAFSPVKPFMGGLMLTSLLYSLLGVLEQRLSSRVYLESIFEYVATVIIIMLIGLFTTTWVG